MSTPDLTPREARIALNLLPNIGPVRVARMLERLGSPQAILAASPRELTGIKGVGEETAATISGWRERIDLDAELAKIEKRGLTVLTPEDEHFPHLLKRIHDPPLALYVWGEITPADAHGVAVVGSRRTTHYGTEAARRFGFQLAHAGLCVVSGLARGIDTAAHEGALASGGRTVAVIGSGLGKLYPPENMPLAERIASGGGAVVSEFPVDFPPEKRSFPLRNRIVAGWSSATLVVEAPEKSGALITAGQAAEMGRDVYAIPGAIDRPTSRGTNRLIQNGARLVMDAGDILGDMETLFSLAPQAPELPKAKPSRPLGADEQKLYDALEGSEEHHIDQLVAATELPLATVSVELMRLEMKRMVKQLPGKYYVKLI